MQSILASNSFRRAAISITTKSKTAKSIKFASKYSTQGPAVTKSAKDVSPHIGFYKTFGRPIGKVLLMATFVYQLAYWGWVKLEKDEIRHERTAEISKLESKLQEVVSTTSQKA